MRLGYVPLAELGAEFLFQVIADRAEQAAVLLTTNLPFSEWTQVIPNARLCKALLDRITDRAHIIETGSESYRFRRRLELRGRHVRSKPTTGVIPVSPQSIEHLCCSSSARGLHNIRFPGSPCGTGWR
jgi:hypothetical protein